MESKEYTNTELKLADLCVKCPVCKKARKHQKGVSFWLVKNIEDGICPACKAYEKVYGKKAHEPEEQE